MADIHRGAGLHDATVVRERREQKLLKLFGRHAVAFDLQLVLCVAFVIHVVGRIGENKISRFDSEQLVYIRLRGCISDKKFVLPNHPQITDR